MRVPQYVSQVSAQGSTASQRISTPASAFGAQEAQGVAAIGQGLDRMRQRAVQIQEEDDAAGALEAFTRATSGLREFTHGEGGFLTRQGRDAYEGLQDGVTEIDRIRSEHSARLNPRQRAAFDNLWRARSEATLNSMSTHAANQRRAYQDQQTAALSQDAVLTASEAWGQPEVVRSLQANAALAITAAMSGQPSEAVNAAIAQMQSQSWMAAIEAAQAAGQYQAAEGIFEANEGQIVGPDLTRARRLIEEGGIRTRGQAGADAVWDRFGENQQSALTFIRNNYEGRERDEVQARYVEQRRLWIAGQAEVEDQTFTRALEHVREGGSVNEIPPELYLELNERQIDALHRIGSNEPLRSDMPLYWDIIQNPQRYADDRRLLVEARSHLTEEHYARALTSISNYQSGVDNSVIRTPANLAASIIRELGINPNSRDGAAEAAAVTSAVENRMQEHQAQHNRPMRAADIDELRSDLTAEYKRGGLLGLGNVAPAATQTSNSPGRGRGFDPSLQADVTRALRASGATMEIRSRGQERPTTAQLNRAHSDVLDFAARSHGVDGAAGRDFRAVVDEYIDWLSLTPEDQQAYLERAELDRATTRLRRRQVGVEYGRAVYE